jgi:hypothetical protein
MFSNKCCSGCYPVFQPNQVAHMYDGGCLENIFEKLMDELKSKVRVIY